jgi:hypothetical protein
MGVLVDEEDAARMLGYGNAQAWDFKYLVLEGKLPSVCGLFRLRDIKKLQKLREAQSGGKE